MACIYRANGFASGGVLLHGQKYPKTARGHPWDPNVLGALARWERQKEKQPFSCYRNVLSVIFR